MLLRATRISGILLALLCVLAPAAPAGALSLLSAPASGGDRPVAEPTPASLLRYTPPPEGASTYSFAAASAAAPTVSSAGLQESLLTETGSSVTILTAEDLARAQAHTVADALRTVPGLDVAAYGGPGQIATVFMRGAASNHTLLLLDGVLMNDPVYPGRGTDVSKLTLDNVERIEIVRGPQSAVFGSGALGGVINIITRKTSARGFARAEAEAGKYGSRLGAVSAAGSLGKWDASGGASTSATEGFSAARRELAYPEPLPAMRPNAYDNLTADVNLGWRALPNLALRAGGRLARGAVSLDAGGGEFGDAKDYGLDYLQAAAQLHAFWDLWEGRWKQHFSLGDGEWRRETHNDPGAPMPSVRSEYQSRQFTADWRNQIGGVTAGVAYRQEQARSYDETNLLYGFPASEFPMHSAHQLGLYLEDQFRWERLAVAAGVRWDHHDQYGSVTTYRVAPTVTAPMTGTRFKASYGTAFNAPSLDQLYSAFGDATLKPETSVGWDAGIEQPFGSAALAGAGYFRADYTNQIVSDPVTWLYRNLGQVRTTGWEAFAQVSPITDLDLRATYTRLLVADFNDFDAQAPLPLVRRADYKATIAADYRLADLKLHAAVRRIGTRLDLDPATYTLVTLAPYTVLDLAAAYAVHPAVELTCRIENALDADYTEVAGYASPRFGAYAGAKVLLQ